MCMGQFKISCFIIYYRPAFLILTTFYHRTNLYYYSLTHSCALIIIFKRKITRVKEMCKKLFFMEKNLFATWCGERRSTESSIYIYTFFAKDDVSDCWRFFHFSIFRYFLLFIFLRYFFSSKEVNDI